MNLETLYERLDRFESAESEPARASIAREILDHDSITIRHLCQLWCGRFVKVDNVIAAWAMFFCGLTVIAIPAISPWDEPAVSTFAGRSAAVLALALFASACVQYYRGSMANITRGKRYAMLAGQVLGYAGFSLYAGRLLANLYGFGDKQRQQVILVSPVADVLADALISAESLDYKDLDSAQRGCVRMFLARRGNQLWREQLAVGILDGVLRSQAVEFVDSVSHLARTARHEEVRHAAIGCFETLKALTERQNDTDLLLRPAETVGLDSGLLLRPAGISQSCADGLLRPAAGDYSDIRPV